MFVNQILQCHLPKYIALIIRTHTHTQQMLREVIQPYKSRSSLKVPSRRSPSSLKASSTLKKLKLYERTKLKKSKFVEGTIKKKSKFVEGIQIENINEHFENFEKSEKFSKSQVAPPHNGVNNFFSFFSTQNDSI